MNFLEEVEPYRVYIDMYLDKGAMPNLKIREELNDLDYRLRMHERLVIYGKTNIELFPTDMACASCVKSMMFNLRRWIKIKENENPGFVKEMRRKKKAEERRIQKIALDMVGWTDKFPEEEAVEFKGVPPIVDLTKLKWGELRKYATSKGISVKGKKKQEIIDEINAL